MDPTRVFSLREEMYTATPHGFLARAIEFIVDRCRNKNRRARRGFVSVSRQKRGPVRFGRSPDTKLFVNLSFDDVLAIVMTDIRSCYSRNSDKKSHYACFHRNRNRCY